MMRLTLLATIVALLSSCDLNPELTECKAEADAIADRCEARRRPDDLMRNIEYCEIARKNSYKYCEREHGNK